MHLKPVIVYIRILLSIQFVIYFQGNILHFIKFEEALYDLKAYTWHYISDLKNMLSFIEVKSHAP